MTKTKTPKFSPAVKSEMSLHIRTTLAAAFALAPAPQRASGCGRVYVCLSSAYDRATITLIAAAAKALGLRFERKAHYGMTNAFYVGYDNGTGRELAKGEAIAAALTAAGLPAYSDAHGD